MASLLIRLFRSLFQRQRKVDRSYRQRARRLQLEPVEARCLMAADFATIGGNVFTDLTDNGKTGDDTALVGATVHLFKDGGNGTYDSSGGTAAGDDTLVDTQTTDASGNYLFDNLDAGKFFVAQVAVSGKVQRSSESLKTVDITTTDASGLGITSIDTFNDDTATITANSTTPTATSVTATSGSNTLGNERDILVNYTSGANDYDVSVSGGLLSVNPGATTAGNVILSYDGTDGDASTLDHTNLSVDLTSSNAAAFQFLAGSEAGNTITINVFSGAGNESTLTTALPVTAGAVPTEIMILRFADFTTAAGTGADFSAVTALSITITNAASADAQLDLTQTVAPFLSTQNLANLNPMSVGNLVWNDVNDNGQADSGESGIPNVSVQLYQDTNSSGSFDSGDTLAGSATTDSAGNYTIGNLVPGSYVAVLPLANFGSGGALEGFVSSSIDDSPNNDTNGINKGMIESGVGAVSVGVLTLVSGGEPTNDGDSDTNSNLSLDFGFVPEFDLAIQSAVSAATYNAGQSATYTLTVTNNGPAVANNVVVVDDIPDIFAVTSGDVTATGGTVNITSSTTGEVEVRYASIPSGQSRTITIVAAIPADQDAEVAVTNSASVTGDGSDTDNTNDSDSSEFDLLRLAVLQLTKSDTPDPSSVGQPLSYSIVVTNVGPSTANNVEVRDTLPAGLTFSSVASTLGTATHTAGQIALDLAALGVGESATITVNTTIDSTFAGSTIANSATAQADEAALVNASSSTTINPQVDLTISQVDNADPVSRGENVTYTLTVTNDGPSSATNVQVTDTLPVDLTYVTATGPTGATFTPPTGSGQDLIVGLGSLASGGTATITVVATVKQTAGSSFNNVAVVSSTESTGGFDPNTANNTDTETTSTDKTIDLRLTKTDSSSTSNPIRPGGTVTYTITAINDGPSDATNVQVIDNIPDGLTITSALVGSTAATIPSSASDSTAANPDDLVFDVGNIASGGSTVITVIAVVMNDQRNSLINAATISTTDTSFIETDSANDTVTLTTTLTPQVDLTVTNTSSASSVTAGGTITYNVAVTNTGPSSASGVTLTDTLPTDVTFTSATSTQGTATHSGGVVTGSLGTIAPGATVTVTINGTVAASARTSLANQASVTSTETDSNSTNNQASATTSVTSSVDLAITATKVDPTNPIVAGGTASYTIVVTNSGPSSANSVQVIDVLPTGLTFTSGSVAGSSTTVSASGQQVSVNLGTMAPGASQTITINANVASTLTGTVSNSASVSATETDSNSTNDSSSVSSTVAVVGSISGRVYLDTNSSGTDDSGDSGIAGVTVTLTGTDIVGGSVSQTATTDSNGDYTFDNLQPGTYTVTQTQPSGFRSAQSNPGTAGGTASNNAISSIVITSGLDSTGNSFGETPNPLSARRFLASSSEFD